MKNLSIYAYELVKSLSKNFVSPLGCFKCSNRHFCWDCTQKDELGHSVTWSQEEVTRSLKVPAISDQRRWHWEVGLGEVLQSSYTLHSLFKPVRNQQRPLLASAQTVRCPKLTDVRCSCSISAGGPPSSGCQLSPIDNSQGERDNYFTMKPED